MVLGLVCCAIFVFGAGLGFGFGFGFKFAVGNFRFLRMQKMSVKRRARTPMAPMTAPTIAPVFDFLFATTGVEVEIPVLLEVLWDMVEAAVELGVVGPGSM